MYGDDTWLKLFPDTFERADGTSSFFVSVSGASQHDDSEAIVAESSMYRISPKLITMLQDMFLACLNKRTGTGSSCIISVSITLGTSLARGGNALQYSREHSSAF